MAIKVIRHGVKTFRVTCPVCGCEFEYEYEDLVNQYGMIKQVKCPDCGEWINHKDYKDLSMPTYPNWPKPGEPIPCTDPWNPITKPYVTWTTTTPGYNLDCDKCPNKPNPDKPVVGDSPCTWCLKMQPYCTTSTADLKIDPNLYKNTTTSYTDLKVNTDYSHITSNYTTDLENK